MQIMHFGNNLQIIQYLNYDYGFTITKFCSQKICWIHFLLYLMIFESYTASGAVLWNFENLSNIARNRFSLFFGWFYVLIQNLDFRYTKTTCNKNSRLLSSLFLFFAYLFIFFPTTSKFAINRFFTKWIVFNGFMSIIFEFFF